MLMAELGKLEFEIFKIFCGNYLQCAGWRLELSDEQIGQSVTILVDVDRSGQEIKFPIKEPFGEDFRVLQISTSFRQRLIDNLPMMMDLSFIKKNDFAVFPQMWFFGKRDREESNKRLRVPSLTKTVI
jgi:hypothetical protein